MAVAWKPLGRTRKAVLAHYGFLVGMGFKALDGALELLAGLGLLSVTIPQIEGWIWRVTSGHVSQGPGGHVGRLLRHGAAHLSGGTKHFATVYLLVEGVVKLLLVIGLLRGLRWSYPVGLALLGMFCVYQGVHLARSFSLFLTALAVLNLIVMALIAIEWRALASTARGEQAGHADSA